MRHLDYLLTPGTLRFILSPGAASTPGAVAALVVAGLVLSCAAPERGDPSRPDAGTAADTSSSVKPDTSGGGHDTVTSGDATATDDDTAAPVEDDVVLEEDVPPPAASFATTVHPILTSTCTSAGCHASGAGGYSITGDVDADYLATLDRVVPGDPDGSKLLKKTSGVSSHSGGPLLTPGTPEYDAVAAWIRDGAAP